MPNPLQKSLHGYLSKIKRETGKLQSSSSKSLSSSKNWVLAGYKDPKKLYPFKSKTKTRFNDHQDSSQAATLSDIDRFLEENFKSLCIREGEEEEEEEDHHHHRRMIKKKEKMHHHSSDEDEDEYRHRFERTWGPPASVYDSPKLPDPSRRLSPPPGSSEGRPSMYTASEEEEEEERPWFRSTSNSSSSKVLPENCIAVLRYTEEPQEDFRRSMVEMMESKLGGSEEVDWDLMEELLFSYLDLNHKKSHKFILSAFVDLIISLRDKEKRVTRKSLERSLTVRAAARERLSKRSHAFRN
ncbi:hypothetical protein Bca52824_025300 [Brassica carinata]|uniref:Transcription repressor n=1 Tax=Brassica carinata TaxID=52824 RepID=A0A8X7VL74_BRACI|nr:hypothetical protein Bca52824_025300 [Brassica carinata]